MLQMLPSNVSSFDFLDIYALRTDENLSYAWSYIDEYSFGNASVANSFNSFCTVYPSYLAMYEGDFTLDQLTGGISNGSYNYGGFNVRYVYNSSMVLINGTAIGGYDKDIQSCIDAVNGNVSSLYGNADIKSIVNRLPVGFELYVWIADNASASENISGLLLGGASVAKSGDNYIETEVYQFNTSDAAQSYVALNGNTSDASSRIEMTQDSVYVTIVTTPITSTPTPTPTP
jgi:hypothetical protein